MRHHNGVPEWLLALWILLSLPTPRLEAQVSVPEPVASPAARAYLSAALDKMQEMSVRRDSIDWPALRARAMARLGPAQKSADTYEALRAAIQELGDRHSYLITPEAARVLSEGAPAGNIRPFLQQEGPIGYIMMPSYAGWEPERADEYARETHEAIASLDPNVCGWIVDLRTNGGGNMWPMLAAVGPILGEGEAGRFILPGGQSIVWSYLDGASYLEDSTRVSAGDATYDPGIFKPAAVLTGPRTASSGEAIAVAFRGRASTRSFGLPTFGLSTGNTTFTLEDGAILNLTTSIFADRTGASYGGRIEPDEMVLEPVAATPGSDPTLNRAEAWLSTRPGCRAPV